MRKDDMFKEQYRGTSIDRKLIMARERADNVRIENSRIKKELLLDNAKRIRN